MTWLALMILAVGQVANAGTGTLGAILVMTGHQNRWFAVSGVMLLAGAALTWILVPRWGLAGAALGIACGVGGLSLSGLLLVRNALGIWPYDRRNFKGLLATALAAGALLLLRMWGIGPPVLSLLSAAIVSTGVFGVTLIVSGLDAEDRNFISLVRARFK